MSTVAGAGPIGGPAPVRAALSYAVALAATATLATTVTLVASATHRPSPSVTPAFPATIGIMRAAGYVEGAPPGFSGGFSEQSCHACHFHAEINTPSGQVTIDGVPSRFVPGTRYPLSITLTRPGMKLGGFQLTARFKAGGAQAGTLVSAPGYEERIAVETQAEIQYASQRREGAALAAPGAARWPLVWIAPTMGGTVVFHVAANAANADETVEGDYVHTAVVESRGSVAR